LALLLVGGAAAWKFFPHTLNHDECSDVYRHFADMRLEGVRVTYVQDYNRRFGMSPNFY
jgi:hypothetical protein